jgi:hypothetical protein
VKLCYFSIRNTNIVDDLYKDLYRSSPFHGGVLGLDWKFRKGDIFASNFQETIVLVGVKAKYYFKS